MLDANYVTADISHEEWREVYLTANDRTYHIVRPLTLTYRRGGSTHRVVDAAGIVHCYPAPETGLSILRWKPKNAAEPVQF